MSYIKTYDDIDFVINDFIESSLINVNQSSELKKIIIEIVEHQKISNYFNTDDTIYNERDIITIEGQILRPDRIIINPNNEVVIIDYKTGKKSKQHQQQLISYQDILETMKFKVVKKYLVYINDTVEVEEV
jgi:predicted Ser/Thr protein kinase